MLPLLLIPSWALVVAMATIRFKTWMQCCLTMIATIQMFACNTPQDLWPKCGFTCTHRCVPMDQTVRCKNKTLETRRMTLETRSGYRDAISTIPIPPITRSSNHTYNSHQPTPATNHCCVCSWAAYYGRQFEQKVSECDSSNWFEPEYH